MVEEQYSSGQVGGFGVGDQTVIDQRQPVPEGFEPLPHRDLLVAVELIKTAGFDGVDQLGEAVVEGVEGRIQPTARSRVVAVGSPSSMPLLYSKMCSMTSCFPNKIRENRDQNRHLTAQANPSPNPSTPIPPLLPALP